MSPLHRLWRRLPHRVRREALFSATALLAPRPDHPAPTGKGSLVVAGYLGASTGLGTAARRLVSGLRAAGFDPGEIDLTGPLRQGPAGPPPRMPSGPGTLVVQVNGPMLPWALLALGRRALRDKRVIAVWNWELPILPGDWDRGFSACHVIWTPSRFTAAACSRAGGPPVLICPNHVPAPDPSPLGRDAFGLPSDAFVSLCLFDATSSLSRKNPLGAISAHRLAFGDRRDRILLLKTHDTALAGPAWRAVAQAAATASNVRVLDAAMPRRDLWALMAASDAVLSLHRAEGFGYVIAEAMVLGRPVVATGWSGNMDFMHGPGTHAVPYVLVPAHDPQDTYAVAGAYWAEPDLAAAATMLVRLSDQPELTPPTHFPLPDYAGLLGIAPSGSIPPSR
ncbi:glycosyltransferase [Rhodopila sp.]|uniref:glycosyltransferase n=1 Tax=Rhodopila sp. TaxID=2480087 RepID=UPI003D0EF8A1